MKYTYAYKSSDGTRHEASMEAPNREAVFAALRAQGIKAIKVVAADGAKANGELRGVRKRVVTAIAVAAALVAGIMAFFLGENQQSAVADYPLPTATSPRHQLYGDPVIIGEMERGKFDEILPREGDQLLAWFAQPGKLMCPKAISPTELRRLNDKQVCALEAVLNPDIAISGLDSREVQELKQIVNGMREEMRDYLANGNGTVRSFWRRLMERTRQESQIYERTRRELENVTDPARWEEKNDALRRLGLRTIQNPNETE